MGTSSREDEVNSPSLQPHP
jgi:staphylococcal nuclease domain-containing protein 1